MKHRLFAVTALILLLSIMGGGIVSADSTKDVTNPRANFGFAPSLADFNVDIPFVCLFWDKPTSSSSIAASKSYRVDWSTRNSGFASYKVGVTQKTGSYYVDHRDLENGNSLCWDIGEAGYSHATLKLPVGKTVRIRIRARYPGEANGGWTKISITRTETGFTSDDITLTNA